MSLLRVVPAFALVALVLAILPGQGVAMVLRQTLTGGARCATWSVLGNSSGLVVWGIASSVGLSEIFTHSPLAYDTLKYTGVAYLGYLSISTLVTLRRRAGAWDTQGPATVRPIAAYRLGLVTNLTNVKAAVFAVAFIPQFVPRNVPLGVGIISLALVQSLVSLGWYSVLVAAVDRAAAALSRPVVRRALTIISATGLLALALILLFSSPR